MALTARAAGRWPPLARPPAPPPPGSTNAGTKFLYRGPMDATVALWKEGGLTAFYAGLVPRGLRMTMAVFILTVAGQQLESLVR